MPKQYMTPIKAGSIIERQERQIEQLQAELEVFKEESRKQWFVAEKYRKALEKLAKLGNGEKYGNSDGNIIAHQALKGEGL